MIRRPRRRRSERVQATPPFAGQRRIIDRFLRPRDTHPFAGNAEQAWLLVDEAVRRATLGTRDPHDRPVPTRDDCLDALAQRVEVQELDDIRELQIIEWARGQGATWREIGVALAYAPDKAKQAAWDRFHTLAERYPYAVTANTTPEGGAPKKFAP